MMFHTKTDNDMYISISSYQAWISSW
jgi:hypothetical protein